MKSLLFLCCILAQNICLSAEQKYIVIIIPSYNNEQWVERNIASAIQQNYENYQIIYIDDCSTDNTLRLVQDYVAQYKAENKVRIIHNQLRCGALSNLYHTIHSYDDNIIIITLDGDDWFEHENVLTRINQEYQNNDVWMTYGQFKIFPGEQIGFCRQLPEGIVQHSLFREYEWVTSHVRTFYAGLFKQVALKELMYEGDFFDVTWDMAFMFPMLEMAGNHTRYISDVLYVYNQANVLNDFRKKVIRQIGCRNYVLAKKKYGRIDAYMSTKDFSSDAIVLSDDPEELKNFIESYKKHVSGISNVYIMCHAYSQEDVERYIELQRNHKDMYFMPVASETFYKKMHTVLSSLKSSHILLCKDSDFFIAPYNALEHASAMHETKAHAFYNVIAKSDSNAPKMTRYKNMHAWQYVDGSFMFKTPFQSGALYEKDRFLKSMIDLSFENSNQMFLMLNGIHFDMLSVGLCGDKACMERKSV